MVQGYYPLHRALVRPLVSLSLLGIEAGLSLSLVSSTCNSFYLFRLFRLFCLSFCPENLPNASAAFPVSPFSHWSVSLLSLDRAPFVEMQRRLSTADNAPKAQQLPH